MKNKNRRIRNQRLNIQKERDLKIKDFICDIAHYPVDKSTTHKMAKLLGISVEKYLQIRDIYRDSLKEELAEVIFFEWGMER